MERHTSCKVTIELYDVTAMEDSTFTVNNKQSFSNIDSIRESQEIVRIATLEPNYFLLDGSYTMKDDISDLTNHIGYMSRYYYSTINSTFGDNHSCAGITFHFYETVPNKIELKFTHNSSWIASDTFNITTSDCTVSKHDTYTEYIYFADCNAEDFNELQMTFTCDDRFVRLNYIDYGVKLEYSEDSANKVKSCSLVEEVDVTSSELSINQTTLELIDSDKRFDITNPTSYYKYLQQRQKFTIYEEIDDTEKMMAIHYLKEWSQTKSMVASFTLQDVIGLMENTTFYGGVYTNVTAKALIDEVMNDYGWTDYTISDEIKDIKLTGYLAVMTHRQALQQIAFACGACVDTSRISGISIYVPTLENSGYIDTDRKLISTAHEIKQEDLVTGIQMTTHSYILESETSQAYKGTLDVGEHRVTFSEPYESLTITGGTINKSNCNYADITVSSAGEVVITGYKYADNTADRVYKMNELPSSTMENYTKVDSATLISKSNVDDVIAYMYKIKQYRLTHTLKMITVNEQVSNMYAVRANGLNVPLLITKMTTDLAGGFTSSVEGIGYALQITDYYRTGTELYAGSEAII